jgi:ABC-2 type transport system permease protein
MRRKILSLLARQVIRQALINKSIIVLMGIIVLLIVFAAYTGFTSRQQAEKSRVYYQQQVRAHWEESPDKHPHRMAHYGYIAFRPKHPLSFFDPGLESYTGSAVFLEAHRQNSVNFSEAGFSTGMLRFGNISMAMVLQVLLPLFIFFTGFQTIAADRENGTLKILLTQGATWKEIMTGKALGLFALALCFLLPVLVVTGLLAGELQALALLALSYVLYFAVIGIVTVLVSAISKTAKLSLVTLTGIWLLCAIVLPRASQAIGSYLHASPSRIAFEAGIEKDLLQKGDSHNPDDPFYKALKDSVLKANGVDSIQQLPFNYSGFQMKQGERMSSEIYNQHLMGLLRTYAQQNRVSGWVAFINPFMSIRQVSMALSGTDFNSYVEFQKQAELYRYQLAQHMNELQIQYISSKNPQRISAAHWKAFPDFRYQPVMSNEWPSLMALAGWLVILMAVISLLSKKLKAS